MLRLQAGHDDRCAIHLEKPSLFINPHGTGRRADSFVRMPRSSSRRPHGRPGTSGARSSWGTGLLLPGPVAACLVAMVLSPSRRLTDQNQNSFDERNSIGFQEGFREHCPRFLLGRRPGDDRRPTRPPARAGSPRRSGRRGERPDRRGRAVRVRQESSSRSHPTGSVIEECPRPPVGPVETDGASRPAVAADPPRAPRYSTLMRKPWPTTHFPDMGAHRVGSPP